VLSRDLSLITIIVRNILSEVDAANGSDEENEVVHFSIKYDYKLYKSENI
tara:strand:- start:117 stop:266 length:150 start_codon:yes stop_codon:yes gene_type:complete